MLSHGYCYSLTNKVISFCQNNGYKFLTFVNFTQNDTKTLFKLSSQHKIQSRFVDNLDFEFEILDFLVFNFNNIQNYEITLKMVTMHKIQRSLLIDPDMILFEDIVSKYRENSLFFLFDGIDSWQQVLMLNDNPKVIFNEVTFNQNGLSEIKVDLQGVQLVAASTTWSPHIIVSGCNSQGS